MIKTLILVSLGGALGSTLRYATWWYFVDNAIQFDNAWRSLFPTFVVNIVGCALIGLFVGLYEKQEGFDEAMRLFFVVGFCGGLTTFSSFAWEGLVLVRAGQLSLWILYLCLSVFLGLVLARVGYQMSRFL